MMRFIELGLLMTVMIVRSSAKSRGEIPTRVVMVDHMGSAKENQMDSIMNGKGGDLFVWEEGVHDRENKAEFHGLMHFPTDNLPSFLEVSEDPDPQNLSPAALQCYCKFKKPKIETIPASSFNNQGDEGDSSFIEEKSIENTAQENNNIDNDGRIGLLEENEHQSLRRSRRQDKINKYQDNSFTEQLDSYENMFTDDEKDAGHW